MVPGTGYKPGNINKYYVYRALNVNEYKYCCIIFYLKYAYLGTPPAQPTHVVVSSATPTRTPSLLMVLAGAQWAAGLFSFLCFHLIT